MRIFTSKRMIALVCSVFISSALLQSCGDGASKATDEEVAKLQKELDSTMLMYAQLKAQNYDFDKEMASRDSVINAQAAEIQSLINQMNGGKKSVKVDSQQAEKQQKELREKENTIKQLQKQLDQQTKQINTLKASSSNKNATKDNSAQYKNQIAQLQKQIAQQEKQIGDLKSDLKKHKNSPSTANCDQVKKNYEERVSGLNSEIKTYKTEIADLNKQIKSLKSDFAKLQSATPKTDESATEELKKTRADLRQLTVELNECRKLNTQYQNDVKAAKDNLATTKAELEASQTQLKSLQASQGEGTKAEQALRGELAAMTEKEAASRARNEELQSLVKECENSKQSLEANISDLRSQVLAMQTRVDQLTNENAALAKNTNGNQEDAEAASRLIADLSAQVENQRNQIASLQTELQQTKNELANAQKGGSTTVTKGSVNQKLSELQALCDSYKAEIERLRAENDQLKSENAELKDKVSSSANLFAENERLQQKVKMASVLVTSDIIVTPGKSVKIGNVVKPTNKASQTKCIRLDCRILDNNVVDPGSMTIYARISDAADRAIYNGTAENFSFDLAGTTMQYTTKQDIEFTGSGRTLTMLWKKGDNVELTPGLYWVKLYANGYEIGKASFKLD